LISAKKYIFLVIGKYHLKRPNYLSTYHFQLSGIVFASGEFWKEHRTFSLNALREFGFGKRSLESKIIEEAVVLVQEVHSKNGQPFNIRTLMAVCISNIMCSINFGQRFEHDDKKFVSLIELINENVSNASILFLADIFPFLRYVPGDPFGIRKVLHNSDVLEEYLTQTVKDHEENFDENNLRDFIDVYLKKIKSEESNTRTTFNGEFTFIYKSDGVLLSWGKRILVIFAI
jgi:cytochrome P450